MKERILLTLRVAHYVAIILAVALVAGKVLSLIDLNPVSHVRSIAASLQQETLPGKSHIVYQELAGYFPLPPSSVWEIESQKDWNDYRTVARKELDGSFQIVRGSADESFYCVRHYGGETQHLEVELVSNKPLRVRCSLLVQRDVDD